MIFFLKSESTAIAAQIAKYGNAAASEMGDTLESPCDDGGLLPYWIGHRYWTPLLL